MSQEFTFSSSNLGRNESKLINAMHHIIDTLYLCVTLNRWQKSWVFALKKFCRS